MKSTYDFIVVGGGSSGCVAAAKLAGVGKARVILLEAGHSHRHPLLDMPPGIFKMINGSKFMHYHQTTPQEHLNGRVHDIPQANVLGGGSSVNAQVYTVYDIGHLLGACFGPRGALRPGVVWHYARPPVVGLDFEMDVMGPARTVIV